MTEAVAELDKINQEETYLDWDPSSYPVLKAMRQNINMYSTLWHTALDFHENYEKWYSGPVSQLDAGAIKTQVIKMVTDNVRLSQSLLFGYFLLIIMLMFHSILKIGLS